MAVTIPVADATIAIRAAAAADAIDPTVASVIGYLFAASKAMVEAHAPDAPDDIQNVATIRLLGWLYDSDPTDPTVGRALWISGAASILAQWRVHRAGVIGGEDAAAAGRVPPPPEDGSFILTSDNGALAWVAFPLP